MMISCSRRCISERFNEGDTVGNLLEPTVHRRIVLFIAPHLSTGGMPQYLLQRIQKSLETCEVYVVEWQDITGGVFVVQREQIERLLGENLYNVERSELALEKLIAEIQPDVIHFMEIPESFLPKATIARIYDSSVAIVETSHTSKENFLGMKKFMPDKFVLVSPHQMAMYRRFNIPCELVEYELSLRERPVRISALEELGLDPNVKHVLNVGLFTPGKNQGELIAIAREMEDEPVQFHFVGNQANNFAAYWRPLMADLPPNCKVWGERSDVDAFYGAMDVFYFASKEECNPLVVKEALSWGMSVLMRDLPEYNGMSWDMNLVTFIGTSAETNIAFLRHALDFQEQRVHQRVPDVYDIKPHLKRRSLETLPRHMRAEWRDSFRCSFKDGARLDIDGTSKEEYEVTFINRTTGFVVYTTIIKPGHFASPHPMYFVDWEVFVVRLSDGEEVFREKLDLQGKRVLIDFRAKGLGDSLAWFPYIEEFRQKHDCQVVASTYWNDLFKGQYPEIEFVKPGTVVKNIAAHYVLGWFWQEGQPDIFKFHPRDQRALPFQATAADILRIPLIDVRARINVKPDLYPRQPGLIGIGMHSTMQQRYWNNPTGWQDVVSFLKEQDKTVLMMSKEPDGFNGNKSPVGVERLPKGYPIDVTIAAMSQLELFIGVTGGLAWLAWTLGIPTIVIAGPTGKVYPQDVVEIDAEDGVCKNCFFRHRFSIHRWDACPDHQDDDRMFECTKSISSLRVIEAVKSLQRRAV